jgi:hypothetical protein
MIEGPPLKNTTFMCDESGIISGTSSKEP